MPQPNEYDISEAKRRVREMNDRASRLFEGDTEPENSGEAPPLKPKNNGSKDNSFLIILSLIMILSQEGADDRLIFALLYLLL